MGADIHPYFQRRNKEGDWEPMWFYGPDREYWHERLIETKVADHSVALAFGMDPDDHETLYKKSEEYFKSMPWEQVLERYGNHPDVHYEWTLPPRTPGNPWGGPWVFTVRDRDYAWFGAIAGVRGSNQLFEQRGLPDEVVPEIRREINQWNGDGHSHSWLMVSEMLEHPTLRKSFSSHVKWFKTHVEDPQNTMMVFFFDN